MTNSEIKNTIIDLVETEGFDIENFDITDENNAQKRIVLDLSFDDYYYNIDFTFDDDMSQEDFIKLFEQKLYSILDNYDSTEDLLESGLSQEQLDRVDRYKDLDNAVNDIKAELQNDINGVHYSDFQDEIMHYLRLEAQRLVDDGYGNLGLMQNYVNDMALVSKSEPLYNRLKDKLDDQNVESHNILYAPNFFNYIESTNGQKNLKLFESDPDQAIGNIVEERKLKLKWNQTADLIPLSFRKLIKGGIKMVQYKKFKLKDYFTIEKVRGINKSSLTTPDNEHNYDYITRTSKNNGIESHTGLVENRTLNEPNTFSLGLLQMTFFLREKPWYGGQFVRKITPKQTLNREQMLYFLTVFTVMRPKLLTVLVRDVDNLFLNTPIDLPVTPTGDPDFKYMSSYIKDLELQRIQKLKAEKAKKFQTLIQVANLDTTTLTVKETNALNQKPQLKTFQISEIFDKPETGDVDLHQSDIDGKGTYFINSGTTNCGIKGKTSRPAKTFPANTITIDFFGNVYYRDYQYKLATHNHVFSFSASVIKNKEVGLYLVSSLNYLTQKFNYQNMLTWKKLQNLHILLPITPTGSIDFDYMQTYITAIEKITIKEKIDHMNKVIKTTEQIINN